MKKILLPFFWALFASETANAQVGIGTSSPHSSAQLDVHSDDKGLLIPRITEASRELLSSPANGLLIYQTDGTKGFYYRQGDAWLRLPDAPATSIIPYSSGADIVSLTHTFGTSTGAAVGLGVSESGLTSLEEIPRYGMLGSYAFHLPANGVIKSISGHFLVTPGPATNQTIVSAVLYAAYDDLGNYLPLATLDLSSDFIYYSFSGRITVDIPVVAGTRLLMVYKVRTTDGAPLSLSGKVSGGIAISTN
jgi:hypothetical protein